MTEVSNWNSQDFFARPRRLVRLLIGLIPSVLLALISALALLAILRWPLLIPILLFVVAAAIGLLIDYRKWYLVWLFTLPFLRNFINIRMPLLDLKPSYLLFLPVVIGWGYTSIRQHSLRLPRSKEFRLLYLALAVMLGVTTIAVLMSASPIAGLRALPRALYIAAVVLLTTHILNSHRASLRAVRVCSISLAIIVALGFVFYVASVLPGGYVIDLREDAPSKVTLVDQDLGEAYEIGEKASFVHRYSVGWGNLYDTSGDFAFVGAFLFLGWAGLRNRQDSIGLSWLWITLFTTALLLTYSRGAWLSAAVGLLTFLLVPRGQWRLRTAVLAVILLAIWLSPKTITERVLTPDASIYSRAARILFSLEIIRTHPVLGVGPGVFTKLLTGAQDDWGHLGVDPNEDVTAHSAILQYVGEQGIIGLAALSFFFFLYVILGFKLIRSARTDFAEYRLACAVFIAFLAFLAHCLLLPSFEDLLWAIYAIGFVLAVQATLPLQLASA